MKTYREFKYNQMADGRILADFPSIGQMLFKSEEEFRAYVDGYHTTQNFFGLFETELRNAIEKHPKFCDKLCDLGGWEEVEDHYKKANDNSNEEVANMVLYEEIAEAMNAYQHGDKKQCLKELAQCGAVIIRMMDFVKKEMEGK